MKKVYEAWAEGEGERWEAMTLAAPDVVSEMMERGLLSRTAVLRFRIEADTIEEAKAVQHIRWDGPHFSPMAKQLPAQIYAVLCITRRVRESAPTVAESGDSALLTAGWPTLLHLHPKIRPFPAILICPEKGEDSLSSRRQGSRRQVQHVNS